MNQIALAYKALYDRLAALDGPSFHFLDAVEIGDTVGVDQCPGVALLMQAPQLLTIQAMPKYSVWEITSIVRVYEDAQYGEFDGGFARGSLVALQAVVDAIMVGSTNDCTAGGAWLNPPQISVKKYDRGAPAAFLRFELEVKIMSTRFLLGTL
jgi:hypothetical protein